MLRAPTLPPDDNPHNPERDPSKQPETPWSQHTLRLADNSDLQSNAGVIRDTNPADGTKPLPLEEREALQALRQQNAVFDDATVRSALTDLHANGEDFARQLAELPGREAHSIEKRTDAFLKEQRENLNERLNSDRQKQLFAAGFGAFTGGMAARSENIREEKTRAWQTEVTEQQNQAFLEQALQSGNVFDDEVQTGYRNMYLLNVDNLHADRPEAERREKLDAANRDFCSRILDKRLELDPGRMRSMLDAPAVRRVLGDETMQNYAAQADAAVRADAVRGEARQWAESGLEPAEVEQKAAATYADETERNTALEQYRDSREKAGRELVNSAIQDMNRAWNEIREGGMGDNPRITALRHTDPAMAAHMEQALRAWRGNGGVPAQADYALLLRLTDAFAPREATEQLRDRQRLMTVHQALGGAESPEFGLYHRVFQGQATEEDASRLEGLRLARDVAMADQDGALPDAELSRYLRTYSENARIYMERNRYKELDSSERTMLARKSAEAMGWGKPTKAERPGGQHTMPVMERAGGEGLSEEN